MQRDTHRIFSLAAVIVAAVLFGMVIAGGVNLTPDLRADRADEPAATAAVEGTVAPGLAPDFATLADRVVPSVVSVYSTEVDEGGERRGPWMPFHPFLDPRQDEDSPPRSRQSSGSGFFISADGEVLTNFHVVEDADRIRIQLHDDEELEVEVIGRDPATDLALLKVKDAGSRTFPALPFGSSEGLRVGEWVMAVGNPLNMDHTVTVGVVSAKGRVLGLSDTSFEDYIQTDAAINFGNSGGPLLNTRGEVIGINTAINARAQNLGFAVPVRIAQRVVPQLREHGEVVRGYLGVSVQNVDERIENAFDLASGEGAFVAQVNEDSAAERAGLAPGDVIVEVDDVQVADTRDLIDYVSSRRPGTEVELVVIRDGERLELTATLDERDLEGVRPAESEGDRDGGDAAERVGITVSELSPRARQFYSVPSDVDGVVITRVEPLSPADEENLRRGDVITQVGGQDVESVDQLIDLIAQVDAGGYLRMYVYRPQFEQYFFAIPQLD